MNYCQYDMYTMSETILQGEMLYVCDNCGYQRPLMPEETLLFERKMGSLASSGVYNAMDIARDKINKRIEINCKCGSKVGAIAVIGPECSVIAVCVHCYENIEL